MSSSPSKPLEPVKLSSVKPFFVENTHLGKILVVTGSVKNTAEEAVGVSRLSASLYGKGRRPIKIEKLSLLNKPVSKDELKTMTQEEFKKKLSKKGRSGSIAAGRQMHVTAVFIDPPAEAYQAEIKLNLK